MLITFQFKSEDENRILIQGVMSIFNRYQPVFDLLRYFLIYFDTISIKRLKMMTLKSIIRSKIDSNSIEKDQKRQNQSTFLIKFDLFDQLQLNSIYF